MGDGGGHVWGEVVSWVLDGGLSVGDGEGEGEGGEGEGEEKEE